ncbi:MAG TPA: hypothetical protein DEG69_14800 [Flavobacteriaceae bacterium]|jgi:hypothetical protein|nr:hypothetical protein [Flavobacteriaceae bacterium]
MKKRNNLVYNKKGKMSTPDKKAFILRLFLDKDTTLIETGTHLGYTISKNSSACKKIHTAEIDANLQNRAKQNCEGLDNITFHLESSDEMLLKIGTGEIKTEPPYVFWLDAHLGNSELELEQKILKRELEVIKANFKKEDIRALLIDDSCGLTLAPDLMTVQECYDTLLEINPNFRISSILRGGNYTGPTPWDADVLMAYDADFFDLMIRHRKQDDE